MLKNLYVFYGRSGAGKSAVMEELRRQYGYIQAESYTDRPKRTPNETGHHFLSKEEFDNLPPLLLPGITNGARYGMTQAMLDSSDLIVLEPKGLAELKETYHGTKHIFVIGIHAPIQELARRMEARGDSKDTINYRLDNDEIRFGMMEDVCDVIIRNIDLPQTVALVNHFISFYENMSL